jgi:hypothetical protein
LGEGLLVVFGAERLGPGGLRRVAGVAEEVARVAQERAAELVERDEQGREEAELQEAAEGAGLAEEVGLVGGDEEVAEHVGEGAGRDVGQAEVLEAAEDRPEEGQDEDEEGEGAELAHPVGGDQAQGDGEADAEGGGEHRGFAALEVLPAGREDDREEGGEVEGEVDGALEPGVEEGDVPVGERFEGLPDAGTGGPAREEVQECEERDREDGAQDADGAGGDGAHLGHAARHDAELLEVLDLLPHAGGGELDHAAVAEEASLGDVGDEVGQLLGELDADVGLTHRAGLGAAWGAARSP